MGLALTDFLKSDPAKAKELAHKIDATREFFDVSMQEGFARVAEDPELPTHYWVNSEKMQTYFSIWADQKQQFDGTSFFNVCEGLAQEKPDRIQFRPIEKPVLLVFGKSDPIVDPEEQVDALKKVFPKLNTSLFENSKHYPHIEEIEKFRRLISEF